MATFVHDLTVLFVLQDWANASNTTQAAHRSCLDHSVCLRNATAHARRHKYQRESPSQPNTSAKDATETLTQYSLKGNCVVSANSCSKSTESNRETYFVCSKSIVMELKEHVVCISCYLSGWHFVLEGSESVLFCRERTRLFYP